MNVVPKDFQPMNTWIVDHEGSVWSDTKEPAYLIDESTGRQYWNESKKTVRIKSLLLTFGTPFVHGFASVWNIARRIINLVTFYHFWTPKEGQKSYNFIKRLKDAGDDLLKIATQPLALIGLELAAIYGIFNPYDGRKLYATIERAQYGTFLLAPCFQPNPKQHAFGGDPTKQNAY